MLGAFLAVILVLPSCQAVHTSSLATKDDYIRAAENVERGDMAGALERLPSQERGGFIDTVERAWLGVLHKNANPKPLIRLRQDVEKRETIRVTAERTWALRPDTPIHTR